MYISPFVSYTKSFLLISGIKDIIASLQIPWKSLIFYVV